MISYRFSTDPNHYRSGIVTQDNDEPRPAVFLLPKEAKAIANEQKLTKIECGVITISAIQSMVAEHYGLDPLHMRSPSRDRAHAYPRQMAMLLAREFTKASLPSIGKRFGGRDHTTVIHGIKATQKRIANDERTELAYIQLRRRLGA